ncbi:MAG: beta-galactosidase trimerization domain-containing protein [Firmicutes bacterium]|nr:beta-galactosidase trimerization domain-containing protein [Bacillota bacterium]
MNFRQVHLDFHTSEAIKGIGEKFSKKQFQQALQTGHVNSITVFSKCHHGWAYHPSKANEIHPHLKFDLLKAQIEAAHEMGVKAPVYISAGLDEKMSRRHPEWLIRNKDESTTWAKDFITPGYHRFCFNSPYLDYLLLQIDEVVKNYDADGIFLDIVGVYPCYCQNCMTTLLNEGKNPLDGDEVYKLAEKVYANYTKRVREVIDKTKKGLPVFHNGGHIIRGRRDLAQMNTHLELESLPTGGWGYDHFPLSARYAQTLGMDFLGMTGKFHTSWGEFGGFKHKNAIRYEVALSAANGAKCSIGDQLAPNGEMDEATYKLIGAGYKELEEKEEWLDEVTPVADIGLLSVESVNISYSTEQKAKIGMHDPGAVRILLEGKYLFNVIDMQEDFSKYKVIILPDIILISEPLKQKLSDFVSKGGKLLATGKSGLNPDATDFVFNFGAEYAGENPYKPDYFRPLFDMDDMEKAAYIFYGDGEKIKLTDGVELGKRENPYFNRELLHFCSHRHTPNSEVSGGPGMTEGKDGIYIAWKVFEDYETKGSLILKKTVCFALDKLLGDKKTLKTTLPAQGITTLMEQKNKKRLVNHLLYASPVKRGNGIEVIEDIIPLYDISVNVKTSKEIKNVYLAPQNEKIPFEQADGVVKYTVPRLECHQMVISEY